MEFLEIIKKRRSIRTYQKRGIHQQILESIIDTARFAPTARGVEPCEFIVITESSILKNIAKVAEHGKFIAHASACIAVFCKNTKYYLEDGCAAVENILLASTTLGIATCWVAGDKKDYCDQIASMLNVPAELKLVALISMGYPESENKFKIAEKRALTEVMHWNKY